MRHFLSLMFTMYKPQEPRKVEVYRVIATVPKQGDNATKTQRATGIRREVKCFRWNREPNPKHETRNKLLLLVKRLGRRVNQVIGKHNYYYCEGNKNKKYTKRLEK